jgi:LysM repeat protein
MRNPNDTRFIKTQQLMRNGMMFGADRPVGRVTYSTQNLHSIKAGHQGMGAVRYIPKDLTEFELGNIRTISIDRSIGQDAATATITMYNADWQSNAPEGIDGAGRLGYLTPGRGEQRATNTSVYSTISDVFDSDAVTYPTDWYFPKNGYRDVLIPNTILTTYQGYGSDNLDQLGNHYNIGDVDSGYVAPKDDTKLYQTGVWLIDEVTFGSDGTISIECRDLAKLLIEQYIYPPMIPINRFPLIYSPARLASGHKEKIGRNVATFYSSSNGAQLRVLGHRGEDAFDGRPGSFWLSTAQPDATKQVWLEAKTHGQVNEIVLDCYGGNYLVYVSVHEAGEWKGTNNIPGDWENDLDQSQDYTSGSGGVVHTVVSGDTLWDLALSYYGKHELWPVIAKANNNIVKDPHWIYPGQTLKIPYVRGTHNPAPGSQSYKAERPTDRGIPYVKKVAIAGSGNATIRLPRSYDAQYVRVTFTQLNDNLDGGAHRAGVRTLTARQHILDTYVASTANKPGLILDWTEPIKEMCAWAGFTWENATGNPPDPLLGRNPTTGHPLRVWGDFEYLGAGPVVATPGDYFVSKSFSDGIRQIVDFIGGIFYIDETGGVQFRLPNIWSGGNFLNDTTAASSLGARFSSHPIEFHEDANLISYEMRISDASVRSEILVIGGYPSVHAKGPVAGGYVLGYNSATHQTSAIDFSDVLSGQYRAMVVPGDASKLFYTEAECQRMAELTALFILFSYRQGSLTAPCHPALQLDDQIRIFERVTSEQNVHYVSGISTSMDLESGQYQMTVTTHWLGTDPNKDWFVNKATLTPAVKRLPAILKRIGKEAGGDTFEQPPYGT